MYKPPQKHSLSRKSSPILKTRKNQYGTGDFSTQSQELETPLPVQKQPTYNRAGADLLAAKMIKNQNSPKIAHASEGAVFKEPSQIIQTSPSLPKQPNLVSQVTKSYPSDHDCRIQMYGDKHEIDSAFNVWKDLENVLEMANYSAEGNLDDPISKRLFGEREEEGFTGWDDFINDLAESLRDPNKDAEPQLTRQLYEQVKQSLKTNKFIYSFNYLQQAVLQGGLTKAKQQINKPKPDPKKKKFETQAYESKYKNWNPPKPQLPDRDKREDLGDVGEKQTQEIFDKFLPANFIEYNGPLKLDQVHGVDHGVLLKPLPEDEAALEFLTEAANSSGQKFDPNKRTILIAESKTNTSSGAFKQLSKLDFDDMQENAAKRQKNNPAKYTGVNPDIFEKFSKAQGEGANIIKIESRTTIPDTRKPITNLVTLGEKEKSEKDLKQKQPFFSYSASKAVSQYAVSSTDVGNVAEQLVVDDLNKTYQGELIDSKVNGNQGLDMIYWNKKNKLVYVIEVKTDKSQLSKDQKDPDKYIEKCIKRAWSSKQEKMMEVALAVEKKKINSANKFIEWLQDSGCVKPMVAWVDLKSREIIYEDWIKF
ncbi:MAG: hypothetical protein KME21_13710 [Desmonostoc vinosum HA7617-LM4]|jgi:hypothetical protein|nr:hypothetical protein [Desmonostoc vinosum HA7617-LM4]